MRFEDRTDLSTVIKIMTDGILLQEMKAGATSRPTAYHGRRGARAQPQHRLHLGC